MSFISRHNNKFPTQSHGKVQGIAGGRTRLPGENSEADSEDTRGKFQQAFQRPDLSDRQKAGSMPVTPSEKPFANEAFQEVSGPTLVIPRMTPEEARAYLLSKGVDLTKKNPLDGIIFRGPEIAYALAAIRIVREAETTEH
ncbi:MAG: hypothetical protein J5J00_05370 [Deltaproteobacteria bacterium]|nr:hypothetical protein [Deltaproteobacteria bacterium]